MADQQFYTIVTTAGKAKIANATAFGDKVNFTTLKVGDSNGNYYEPTENQMDLVHTVWSGTITNVSVDPNNLNWLIIAVSIPATDGGFMIREVGIFDDTGTMIAIGKYPETYKPTSETGSTKDLTIKTILEVSNSGSVELKIDPNVIIATKADFNALAGTGRTTETVKKNADDITTLGTQMADIAINIKHPPLPLNPCKCDGVTDDSAQLLAILNLNPNIFIPPDVTCYLALSVELPNNTVIAGIPFHSTIKTNGNSVFTMEGTFIDVNTIATHKENLKIYGIKFICDNPSNNHAVSCKTVDNIEVSKCVVDKMPLINIGTVYSVNAWDGTTNPNATAGITSEDALSHNVLFEKNLCVGDASITATCISTGYCIGKKVKENYVNNYGHGIQWWGGDSNVDRNGAISNPRWDRNIEVNSNIVKNVRGGGIWGSMGKTVSVHHNYVENCGDVGIDTEGNEDFIAHHNTVKNCKNACLGVFAYCIGTMKFHHNKIEQDGSIGSTLFHNWNDRQTAISNVELDNNDFLYSGIANFGSISGDAMAKINVTNNNLNNVLIAINSNNMGYANILKNNILITNASDSDINIVSIGNNHMAVKGNGVNIDKNIIKVNSTLGVNSNVIIVSESSFNNTIRTLITNNQVIGIPNSINVIDNGANVRHQFVIKNNTVSGNIINSSGANRGPWYLENNKDFSNHNVPNAIPTSGTWYSGQHIKFDSPDADGYTEAICTVSGTPGTWKRTGLVA